MSKTFCVAALLVLFANYALSSEQEAQVAKMKEALAALKAPALTAYKTSSDDKDFDFDEDTDKLLYGWQIKASKKIEDKALFARTSEILTDKKTYGGDGAKCFMPGFAFRFKEDAKQFTFVICLECNWVYATDGKEKHQWALSKDGNAALLKLYKEIFGEGEAKK